VGKPKKHWGQNFLRNRGAVAKIVEAIEAAPDELVLEIGPGEGVLTEKLVELPNEIAAVEIDPELAERLRARFGDRIALRHEDAVDAALPERPFRAVGNLPYNVGTPILRRVIAHPHCRRAVFMLQKEVADRVVAKPGSDPYGYLTLYVAMFARARVIMTLDPRSFYPPPKVRSAVVVLDPIAPQYASERDVLLELISKSFRMRRKKLLNNLVDWQGLTRQTIEDALTTSGIDLGVRAETLSLSDFDHLAQALQTVTQLTPTSPSGT